MEWMAMLLFNVIHIIKIHPLPLRIHVSPVRAVQIANVEKSTMWLFALAFLDISAVHQHVIPNVLFQVTAIATGHVQIKNAVIHVWELVVSTANAKLLITIQFVIVVKDTPEMLLFTVIQSVSPCLWIALSFVQRDSLKII